jgi:hypothetical protein
MNFLRPITPATSGPLATPMRTSTFSPLRRRYSSSDDCMSSAIFATASA